MTQLRRDAAYIRTRSHERTGDSAGGPLSSFDEQVYDLLDSAHTVVSVTKTLTKSSQDSSADLENRVADSMQRLLQAEKIQLSPDS